jgi:hypothetical protein
VGALKIRTWRARSQSEKGSHVSGWSDEELIKLVTISNDEEALVPEPDRKHLEESKRIAEKELERRGFKEVTPEAAKILDKYLDKKQ